MQFNHNISQLKQPTLMHTRPHSTQKGRACVLRRCVTSLDEMFVDTASDERSVQQRSWSSRDIAATRRCGANCT